VVVGFAGVCWLLFNILNVSHIRHIHGWQSFGLALAVTALLFAAGRLLIRKMAASAPAQRDQRERARRHK
jgi:hypothetical protein